MDIHKHARTTPLSRADLVGRVVAGEPVGTVAQCFGVDGKTVRKWVARFRAEGPAGLQDRSSRPHRLNGETPQDVRLRIVELRRQRLPGKQIADLKADSSATVSRVLAATPGRGLLVRSWKAHASGRHAGRAVSVTIATLTAPGRFAPHRSARFSWPEP